MKIFLGKLLPTFKAASYFEQYSKKYFYTKKTLKNIRIFILREKKNSKIKKYHIDTLLISHNDYVLNRDY